MVARARKDPLFASRTLLGLMHIDEPTREQEVGAILIADFITKVSRFLSKE